MTGRSGIAIAIVAVLLAQAAPLATAAQNDCGSGRDAPNVQTDAVEIFPTVSCANQFDQYDHSDWFHFTMPEGARLAVTADPDPSQNVELCLRSATLWECHDDGWYDDEESRTLDSDGSRVTIEINKLGSAGGGYTLAVDVLPNNAPRITALTCGPGPVTLGDPVVCDVTVQDENAGVFVTMTWGDGSTTRHPSTGTWAPGATYQAQHTYNEGGDFDVRAVATDTGYPARSSSERPASVTVDGNERPVIVSVTCAPAPTQTLEPVDCELHAFDDSDGVAFDVDWGNGATSRVPASGFVAPSTRPVASFTYADAGTFTVTVTARDDDAAFPLVSNAKTATATVVPNEAPVVAVPACSSATTQTLAAVTCAFTAADDSPGVFFDVNWGDGATTRVPATGTVAPGTSVEATHAWSAPGTFSVAVTATDSNDAPLSDAAATTVTVTANDAPVVTTVACTPADARVDEIVRCDVAASDDSPGVAFMIDWGDGTTERYPATGHVTPGDAYRRTHRFASAGAFAVRVTATDDNPEALTSAPFTLTQNVREPFVQQAAGRILVGHALAASNGFTGRFGGPDGADGYLVAFDRPARGGEGLTVSATGPSTRT